MELVGGRLPVGTVMDTLAAQRPVFHSEADFQFAFAQAVASLDPTMRIRLEVRQPGERGEYVDLGCTGDARSLIEFKYATARWTGSDGITDEDFHVRGHAAMDLARHGFIHDVYRLERFSRPGTNGFAIMLTNDPSLWRAPVRPNTRDAAFRIHEGAELSGTLIWGAGDYPANDRTLLGTYTANWHPYSTLPGPNGEFRWLAWPVTPQEREETATISIDRTSGLPAVTLGRRVTAEDVARALEE